MRLNEGNSPVPLHLFALLYILLGVTIIALGVWAFVSKNNKNAPENLGGFSAALFVIGVINCVIGVATAI